MISGLNHITFAVSNLDQSLRFYRDLLGFSLRHQWDQGAYLEAGELWLCLTLSDVVDVRSDYTHVAFSATQSDLEVFRKVFDEARISHWQENTSEGDSLYVRDPDGHKLEVHVGSLNSRLESLSNNASVSAVSE